MLNQLIAELLDRVSSQFDESKPPTTLEPFTPPERYLLCVPVLKSALTKRTFAYRTTTGKQVISTLPKPNGNTIQVEFYQAEKEAFMLAELWELVTEPTDKLKTATNWQAYVFLALMRNYSKHLNYLKHGRENEPQHEVEPVNWRGEPNDEDDWRPGDMIAPSIERDDMRQHELELLRDEIDILITSAKQNREYSEQLESMLGRFRDLIEAMDLDPATIRLEIQRERRNLRDNESRKRRLATPA